MENGNKEKFYKASVNLEYVNSIFASYTGSTKSLDFYFKTSIPKSSKNESIERKIRVVSSAIPEMISKNFKVPRSSFEITKIYNIEKLNSGEDLPKNRIVDIDKIYQEMEILTNNTLENWIPA